MLFDEGGAILLVRFVVPREGGEFVFTVEELSGDAGYELSPSGRYRHTPGHVGHALAAAGFRSEIVPAELRLEAGEPVAGLVVRATIPPGRP